MQQYMTFIEHHWLLFLILVLLVIIIIVTEYRNRAGGSSRLSPQDATLLINRQNATVVDIRDMAAFKNAHIVGALNLPIADLETNVEKLAKYKNKPLILVHSNELSAIPMASKLRKQGFTQLYVLAGGLQAWKSAGFPLSKSS